jgi:hypothetical protein
MMKHVLCLLAGAVLSGCAEMSGIKFHAPIDMLIARNRIHDAHMGIWLNWMTQGTRVTQNLCYRNVDQDLFLEVNHKLFVATLSGDGFIRNPMPVSNYARAFFTKGNEENKAVQDYFQSK